MNEELAAAVKDYRGLSGLTQRELAAEAEVSTTLVRSIESGSWGGKLSRSPAASKLARYIGAGLPGMAGGWVDPLKFAKILEGSGLGPTALARGIGRSRAYVESLRRNTRYARVTSPGVVAACEALGIDPGEVEE